MYQVNLSGFLNNRYNSGTLSPIKHDASFGCFNESIVKTLYGLLKELPQLTHLKSISEVHGRLAGESSQESNHATSQNSSNLF